ncbi:MAG: tetratricopeptide repeat protein [Deltaproteobacteria bacterium]|nr:tetratricopeptide repeat protein [Deltaproteobacteria bacterium]
MTYDDRCEGLDERRWEQVEEATEFLLDGNHPEALARLRDALLRDPANAYAYHYTGVAMAELGKHEAARDAFAAAVKVAPEYLAARVGLAHALRRTGDLLGAITEAQDAIERFPQDGDAHYAIALALASAGDRAAAIPHLEAFLRSGPEIEAQIEARQMLAMLAEGKGAIDFE